MYNIFFDLDGTIINSEPGLLCAHRHALEQLGYVDGLALLEREGIGWTIGPPLRLSVPRLIGSGGPDKAAEYIALFQRLYHGGYYRQLLLYEGVEQLLHTLWRRGKKLFICTSKPQPIAEKVIQHLGLKALLSGLVGGHIDERPHQKSELLSQLCGQHGCESKQSAIVGDRSYDMLAGQALQFNWRIGVSYGFGSKAELQDSGASHIVSRALDILQIAEDADHGD